MVWRNLLRRLFERNITGTVINVEWSHNTLHLDPITAYVVEDDRGVFHRCGLSGNNREIDTYDKVDVWMSKTDLISWTIVPTGYAERVDGPIQYGKLGYYRITSYKILNSAKSKAAA